MAVETGPQENVAVNRARNLIFWGGTNPLCYNYKTGQWSLVSAYSTLGLYDVNSSDADIGTVRFFGAVVDLQDQLTSYPKQTATLTSGEADLNQGGRAVVNSVRPLINGGTTTVRVGTRDSLSDSVSWSTSTSLNSRTDIANFRSEGRYHRVEFSNSTMTTAQGFEIGFHPQGKV